MSFLHGFTSYPLFRLTISLAVGIFFSDRFLPDSTLLPYCFYALGACVVGMFCLYFVQKYRSRMLFGLVSCLSFALLGCALFLINRDRVRYDWPQEERCYIGVVKDFPLKRAKTQRSLVAVCSVKSAETEEWKPVHRDIYLYWMADSLRAPLTCGDSVCFVGRVKPSASSYSFPGFNYGKYIERQGISGTALAFSGKWIRLPGENRLTFRQHALALREKIVDMYAEWGLKGDVLAVMSALTVGDKTELTDELKTNYNAAGTSHVLALSGLHIGILSVVLMWLLFPLRLFKGGKYIATFCVMALLWGFALMTGLTPSVVRAVIMFSFYVIASLFLDNRFPVFYALTLAAFLMLLFSPMLLFDVSFQLSFVAVASIVLFLPLLNSLFPIRNVVCRYFYSAMALSFSAQLGTFPFILYYFGTFPTYFLLANLVVSPLSVCILGGTLVALCMSSLGMPASVVAFFVKIPALSAELMNEMMEWVRHLSGSSLTSVYFSFFQAAAALAVILLAYGYVMRRSSGKLICLLLVFNVLLADIVREAAFPSQCRLYFSSSSVYTSSGKVIVEQTSDTGLMKVKDLYIGVMNDDRWCDKQANRPLSLDYVYVTRGFKGSVAMLETMFRIKQIVLDTSLSEAYKSKLKLQCEERNISCIEMPENGTYVVPL